MMPLILNLGCGPKTSALCTNIDWSMYVIVYRNAWALPILTPIIGRDRAERIRAMRGKVVVRDLRKEFPFPMAPLMPSTIRI
jgi:hypothetical protein